MNVKSWYVFDRSIKYIRKSPNLKAPRQPRRVFNFAAKFAQVKLFYTCTSSYRKTLCMLNCPPRRDVRFSESMPKRAFSLYPGNNYEKLFGKSKNRKIGKKIPKKIITNRSLQQKSNSSAKICIFSYPIGNYFYVLLN